MKALRITLIMAVILIACTTAVSAQESTVYNTKILIHGTKPITPSSPWQTAGWIVLPNLGPGTYLCAAGPRYQSDNWWIEAMAAALVTNAESEDGTVRRQGQGLIDVRAELSLFKPISLWANVEYYFKDASWYTYLEADYCLPWIGVVGLETENMHYNNKPDDLGYGPHIKFPLGNNLMIMGTYQFHSGPNVIWLRSVINL